MMKCKNYFRVKCRQHAFFYKCIFKDENKFHVVIGSSSTEKLLSQNQMPQVLARKGHSGTWILFI